MTNEHWTGIHDENWHKTPLEVDGEPYPIDVFLEKHSCDDDFWLELFSDYKSAIESKLHNMACQPMVIEDAIEYMEWKHKYSLFCTFMNL